MRKIGLLAFAVLLISVLTTSVFADGIQCSIDTANDLVKVSGKTAAADEFVTMQIFEEEKTTDDFVDNVKDAENFAVYAGQTVSDENGGYSFEFRYKGETGKLNGYVTSTSSRDIEYFRIDFMSRDDYKEIIDCLNNEKDFDAFFEIYNANKAILCTKDNLVGEIDITEAIKILFTSVDKKALSADDSVTNEKRIMNALVAQMFNENKCESVNIFSDVLYLDDGLARNLKDVTQESGADRYFIELVSGREITSDDEFVDIVREGMILTAVAYPNGFAKLKELCEEYGDFIGIGSKKYSSDVYKSIAGENIKSLDDLKKALENTNSRKPSSGTTGSSHGSGSGGGGGSRGSGAAVAITGDILSNSQLGEIYMPFVDLSATAWAYEAVSVLADKGIVNGKTSTEFYPNDYVKREEFVKMVTGALGIDAKDTGTRFWDVDNNSWYAKYVYTAYNSGVCKGISESEFGVGSNIIRQDAAVMIYNAIADKNNIGTRLIFADYADISDYAKNAVDVLSSNGIINGKGNNNFEPLSPLTRAEAAQIIYKTFFCI